MRLAVATVALVATIAVVVAAIALTVPGQSSGGLAAVATRVRVATTTSLYATGLLDYLADAFRKLYPWVAVDFVAVGTGAALRLAERGDVCAVFVHAPDLERVYVERGVLVGRRTFAYNYFVLVGPKEDPAGARGSANLAEAFRRVYVAGTSGRATFVSRGDRSGTHSRELKVWELLGISPEGESWYLSCGCGMDFALMIANELKAYTLSDLGTYLKLSFRGRLPNLEVIYASEDDPLTLNLYSAYLVSSCSGTEREYAELLIEFIYVNRVELLEQFASASGGQPLLYPATAREELWWELSPD